MKPQAKTSANTPTRKPRYRIPIGSTKPNRKLNELGRQAQNWVMVECVLTWAKMAQQYQLSIEDHIQADLGGDIFISKELYDRADGFAEAYSYKKKVLEESNMDYDITQEWTAEEWERMQWDPNLLEGLNYLFHSGLSDGLWNEQNYQRIQAIQPQIDPTRLNQTPPKPDDYLTF
ncbi:hypothetical protein NG796_16895 [Laspinema sp. A4]|uniref:hypothetical protein n=1 Tax=Laspinema sp. D2d TaxID=2953686 RepID=UPI0021BB8E06|nr:hypothetical protein [Laspinema sp. D2d]MCT7984951.1 hypothetical protein [Laspinema sp. D2d]